MISPDDLLHSRSIVDDLAAQDGEKKEALQNEPFVHSTVSDKGNKKRIPKKSKEPDPFLKHSFSSEVPVEKKSRSTFCHEDDSSSDSSLSNDAASSSSLLHLEEGNETNEQTTTVVKAPTNSTVTKSPKARIPSSSREPLRMTEPRTADILLGRGKPFQSHQGNQFMLHAVDQLRDDYLNTDRKGKHNIIEHVLGLIQKRGGRFVVRVDENEDHSPWVEVKRSISYRKVGHAFRSKARRAPSSPAATSKVTGTKQYQTSPSKKVSVSHTGTSAPPLGRPHSAMVGQASAGMKRENESNESTAQEVLRTRTPMRDNNDIGGTISLFAAAGGTGPSIVGRGPAMSSQPHQVAASTTVDSSLKRIWSQGQSRIGTTNQLLGLPERLPPAPTVNSLQQNEGDGRLSTAWLLRQQQQQLHALNDLVSMEHRRGVHHDAVLALRDREQQVLGILSQQQQQGRPGGLQGASFLTQHGDGVNHASLLLPPRISLPTTSSSFHGVGNNVSDLFLPRSSSHAASSLGSFARNASSTFLIDPTTPGAVELFIMEQQRRRTLMQQEVLAAQRWAAVAAATQQHDLLVPTSSVDQRRYNRGNDSVKDGTPSSPSERRRA